MQAPHIIFDRPGTYFSPTGEFSLDAGNRGQTTKWTFRTDDIAHLVNSLYHSDLVINVDSTLTLDAAALNKSSILIAYDGDRTLPYRQSIAFIYERDHYQHVLRTGGASLVHSHDELVKEINMFLSDPTYRKEGLARLKENLLYKVDGHSGERMGRAILELIS
jgi:CDP-glycerol glycerophosphotransferase (TagB/SpsB family)